MPSDRRSSSTGSAVSAHSSSSRRDRGNTSMGPDGGEVGKRIAAEDEYIKRELMETNAFCNAFWGSGDAGYDVIQARLKGAQRTLEDLRALYRERADIEAEYAKRLAKLSRQALGKEETGALRAALDTVKAELDTTSRTHSDLANMIKKDLEGSVTDFQSKALQSRRNAQASIEKLHKNKQTQEQYVAKSRDKYEQDCIKINGYTAQSSLVQGRDLDKVSQKLDKAQATVAQNDRDYQNFVRALKDTTLKWNSEWKSYLDQCQDAEEDRLDFMKSNLWNYANAVSAVCVADDESCERVRVSLENVDTPRDIQLFIQYCGTGSMMPAAPEYINYAKGQPPPPRPTFHAAKFQRNSIRPTQLPISQPQQLAQPPTQSAVSNPGSRQTSANVPPAAPPAAAATAPTPPSHRSPAPGAVPLPGMVPGQPSQISTSPGPIAPQELSRQAIDPSAHSQPTASLASVAGTAPQDKRMSARNFLARTSSLSHSKGQPAKPPTGTPAPLGQNTADSPGKPSAPAPAGTSGGADDAEPEDPIAKALANLRLRHGAKSPGPGGSPGVAAVRRDDYSPVPPPQAQASVNQQQPGYGSNFAPQQPAHPSQIQSTYRAPSPQPHRAPSPQPHRAPSPSIAQGHPPQRARSPSAAFMQAPARSASPLPVEDVVGQYGQSFPGERKALSRQNSTASRMSMQPSASTPGGPARSPSKNEAGFAGVGARGRSPSPQPFAKQQQPPPAQSSSYAAEDARRRSNVPPRSTTPLGISLDATGSVTHDQMADEYIRRTGGTPGPQTQPHTQPHPQVQQHHAASQMHPSQTSPAIQTGSTTSYQGVAPPRPSSAAPHEQQHPPAPQQQHAHHAPAASTYQPPTHQSQPSMLSQYGGTPSAVQRPPSVGGHHQYSYQGSVAQPGYQTAPPPAQSGYPAAADPRAYGGGGYVSPAPFAQPAPSQSVPAHMSQPQYSPAPSTMQQHYQQPSSYYQQPPPAQETPAAAYMHQYQQRMNAQPVNGHAQQPSAAPQHVNGHGHGHGHAQQLSLQQGQAQPHRATSPAPAPAPAPAAPAPGPAAGQQHPPTGQFSDSGQPILFYVKALYDYQATMDEEFSFTAGDIIAVTHTEADGWWQGELLDEARRRPGSNTFPSNFVVLLM